MYAEARVKTDRLYKNPSLLRSFVQQFNGRLETGGAAGDYAYQVDEVWLQLEDLRKDNSLPKVRALAKELARPAVRRLKRMLYDA